MRWRQTISVDILVVCTGNVCRSPYVAARLAAELPELVVASAGTGALVGEPPTEQVIELLGHQRTVVPAVTARAIARPSLRRARLIVTAERRHRVDVTRLARDAGQRAFTLRELARVVRDGGSPTGLGVDGVAALARDAAARGDDRDHEDDLADPYGRGVEDYRLMAETAEYALGVVVPALREPAPRD